MAQQLRPTIVKTEIKTFCPAAAICFGAEDGIVVEKSNTRIKSN
jgi:hypothetical protein